MKVFHANKLVVPFVDELPNFPEDYKLVADVKCNTLDEAYALTQNVTSSWVMNKEVTSPMLQCRSTSFGDIIIDNDNEFYIVEMIGFNRFKVPPTVALKIATLTDTYKIGSTEFVERDSVGLSAKVPLTEIVKIHDEMEDRQPVSVYNFAITNMANYLKGLEKSTIIAGENLTAFDLSAAAAIMFCKDKAEILADILNVSK